MKHSVRKADKEDDIQYWAVETCLGVVEYFQFECVASAYARLCNRLAGV